MVERFYVAFTPNDRSRVKKAMDKIMEGLKSVNHAKTYGDVGGLSGYMDTIRQNLNIIEEVAGNSYSRFDKATREDSKSLDNAEFAF